MLNSNTNNTRLHSHFNFVWCTITHFFFLYVPSLYQKSGKIIWFFRVRIIVLASCTALTTSLALDLQRAHNSDSEEEIWGRWSSDHSKHPAGGGSAPWFQIPCQFGPVILQQQWDGAPHLQTGWVLMWKKSVSLFLFLSVTFSYCLPLSLYIEISPCMI